MARRIIGYFPFRKCNFSLQNDRKSHLNDISISLCYFALSIVHLNYLDTKNILIYLYTNKILFYLYTNKILFYLDTNNILLIK